MIKAFGHNRTPTFPPPLKRIPDIAAVTIDIDQEAGTTDLVVVWNTHKIPLHRYNGDIIVSASDIGEPEDVAENDWLSSGSPLPDENENGETTTDSRDLNGTAIDYYVYGRVRIGRGPDNWGNYGYLKYQNTVAEGGGGGTASPETAYGFVDRDESIISFAVNDLGGGEYSRVFTITPTVSTFDVYIAGKKYSLEELTAEITDTPGLWTVYLVDDGGSVSLEASQTFPGMDNALVAIIYWSSALNAGLLTDERHGYIMDTDTHLYLHNTVGVRYYYGLSLTEAAGVLTITEGVIYDEDLRVEITEQNKCTILYRNGEAYYEWDEGSSIYYKLGVNSRVCYNDGLALVEAATANKYVAYWIFATNDADYPVYSLAGQTISDTIAQARTANVYQNLALGELPSKEMKLIYRVLLKTDGTFAEAQDLRVVSNMPSGTYLATDHRTLTNIGTMTHDELEAAIGALSSAYVYIAYASDNTGTDFTLVFDPVLDYSAILSTTTELDPPIVTDFAGLWKNYKGDDPPTFHISTDDPDDGVGEDGDFYAKYVDI